MSHHAIPSAAKDVQAIHDGKVTDDQDEKIKVAHEVYVANSDPDIDDPLMIESTYYFPKGIVCTNEFFNEDASKKDEFSLEKRVVIRNKVVKEVPMKCSNQVTCGGAVKCEVCDAAAKDVLRKLNTFVVFIMGVEGKDKTRLRQQKKKDDDALADKFKQMGFDGADLSG